MVERWLLSKVVVLVLKCDVVERGIGLFGVLGDAVELGSYCW